MRKVQNTNVCVIGGAGFIGSHLVDYLIEEKNCNVIVLDNLITGQTKNINSKAKFIWHDIRDNENELTRILKNYNIEYVFNYIEEYVIGMAISNYDENKSFDKFDKIVNLIK